MHLRYHSLFIHATATILFCLLFIDPTTAWFTGGCNDANSAPTRSDVVLLLYNLNEDPYSNPVLGIVSSSSGIMKFQSTSATIYTYGTVGATVDFWTVLAGAYAVLGECGHMSGSLSFYDVFKVPTDGKLAMHEIHIANGNGLEWLDSQL